MFNGIPLKQPLISIDFRGSPALLASVRLRDARRRFNFLGNVTPRPSKLQAKPQFSLPFFMMIVAPALC